MVGNRLASDNTALLSTEGDAEKELLRAAARQGRRRRQQRGQPGAGDAGVDEGSKPLVFVGSRWDSASLPFSEASNIAYNYLHG